MRRSGLGWRSGGCRRLALRSDKVINALGGADVLKVIVRAPRLVNVVPGSPNSKIGS
jgi:leucyl-tRNA synthetase